MNNNLNASPEPEGGVSYPGIVDQKTLSACLGTAEQIIRGATPERRDMQVERFRRTKAKLIAQIKAHPMSFDEWNRASSIPAALSPEIEAEVAEIEKRVKAARLEANAPDEWWADMSRLIEIIRQQALVPAPSAPLDAERENAARLCEDLVTFTANHETGGCGWCDALDKAAEEIRSGKRAYATEPTEAPERDIDATVHYPCTVDHKTLVACLRTVDLILNRPLSAERLARFHRMRDKLFAQASVPSASIWDEAISIATQADILPGWGSASGSAMQRAIVKELERRKGKENG